MTFFTERYSNEQEFSGIISYLKEYKVDDQRETLHAKMYLAAIQKLGWVQYPLVLEKRESPDFQIEMGGSKIGLEHTIATHPQYKQLRDAIIKDGKPVLYETDIFKPNTTIPRKNLKNQILNEGKGLKGQGHVGWSAEQEFIDFCLIAVQSKTVLLNKPHFQRFEKNALIIEEDTPIMVRIRPDIVAQLLEGINFWGLEAETKFDEVVLALDPNLLICTRAGLVSISVAKKDL